MSALTQGSPRGDYALLIRDVRHLAARAAPDLADWLAYLENDGKAVGTLYQYTRELALLLRTYPDLKLDQFTDVEINHVLALKPQRSRHITRSIFNGFFEWAALPKRTLVPDTGEIVTTRRIPFNPMPGLVPKMRQPKRRPKDIWSVQEVALLSGLPIPDGPLWTLLFQTGLRKSEARNLRREHINLERALLVVYHGKGDKDRIAGLPFDVVRAVSDLDLTEGLNRADYLWYSKPGGGKQMKRSEPISTTTFDRWYQKGLADAGILRYLNPHATRHTFGHWLLDLGFDLEKRSKAMGHESTKTTERFYSRVNELGVAAEIARIGL